jgi:hypothetical protein
MHDCKRKMPVDCARRKAMSLHDQSVLVDAQPLLTARANIVEQLAQEQGTTLRVFDLPLDGIGFEKLLDPVEGLSIEDCLVFALENSTSASSSVTPFELRTPRGRIRSHRSNPIKPLSRIAQPRPEKTSQKQCAATRE